MWTYNNMRQQNESFQYSRFRSGTQKYVDTSILSKVPFIGLQSDVAAKKVKRYQFQMWSYPRVKLVRMWLEWAVVRKAAIQFPIQNVLFLGPKNKEPLLADTISCMWNWRKRLATQIVPRVKWENSEKMYGYFFYVPSYNNTMK